MSRRAALKGVLGLSAIATLSGCVSDSPGSRAGSATKLPRAIQGQVAAENQRPGTRDWLLTKTRIDPKTKYRCPWIEGYCSRTSGRAGETIEIFVSTNPPSPFTIDLYRMGYYGGTGARQVASLGPFKGDTQPDPPIGQNRVRESQ